MFQSRPLLTSSIAAHKSKRIINVVLRCMRLVRYLFRERHRSWGYVEGFTRTSEINALLH